MLRDSSCSALPQNSLTICLFQAFKERVPDPVGLTLLLLPQYKLERNSATVPVSYPNRLRSLVINVAVYLFRSR
jgi:hypothetical protein